MTLSMNLKAVYVYLTSSKECSFANPERSTSELLIERFACSVESRSVIALLCPSSSGGIDSSCRRDAKRSSVRRVLRFDSDLLISAMLMLVDETL